MIGFDVHIDDALLNDLYVNLNERKKDKSPEKSPEAPPGNVSQQTMVSNTSLPTSTKYGFFLQAQSASNEKIMRHYNLLQTTV